MVVRRHFPIRGDRRDRATGTGQSNEEETTAWGGFLSRTATLLVVGAPTLASGCSLALVDGPPDVIPVDQPIPEGACTVEKTLPFADAVGAGTFLFLAATSSDGDRVRFGVVLGGALGYSAYSGFRSVRHCRSRMLLRPKGPPSQPPAPHTGGAEYRGPSPLSRK